MFVFSSIHFQCLYRPDAQCSCFLPFIFNAYTDQTLNLPTLNLPTRRSIYISIYLSTLNLSIYLSRIFFSFSHTPITPPCRSARTIASAASARTVQLVSRKAHLSVQALFVTDIFFIFAHVSVFFRSFSMLIPTRKVGNAALKKGQQSYLIAPRCHPSRFRCELAPGFCRLPTPWPLRPHAATLFPILTPQDDPKITLGTQKAEKRAAFSKKWGLALRTPPWLRTPPLSFG